MRFLASVFCLAATLSCGFAQTQPIDTEPPLPTTFPFVAKGDSVSVANPILVSTTTIIPANAILRVIYVPPVLEDDRMRAIRTPNNSENSWTRNNALNQADKISPSEQARLKVSRETVWPSVTNFQLALATLHTDDIRIVYLVPNETMTDFKFFDEHIALPEGLLLSEMNHAVTVLAVVKNGSSAKAGIKAGDVITKTGDTPTNGSLETFLNGYHAVHRAAEVGLKPSFAFTVKGTDGAERVVSIRMPPTISSGFLDAPITESKPSASSAKTNAPSVLVPEVWENKKPTQPPAPNP